MEDYAYAAGLVEPVTPPGVPEPAQPLEDEYALVESAEPDAWQAEPGSEAPPETEEPAAQEPPEAASGAAPVDIVTVVDDLLDDPAESPGPKGEAKPPANLLEYHPSSVELPSPGRPAAGNGGPKRGRQAAGANRRTHAA